MCHRFEKMLKYNIISKIAEKIAIFQKKSRLCCKVALLIGGECTKINILKKL
jgi:hypothetical protein